MVSGVNYTSGYDYNSIDANSRASFNWLTVQVHMTDWWITREVKFVKDPFPTI